MNYCPGFLQEVIGMKILVADHDEFVRVLLSKTLNSYSHTVEVVGDGQTALEMATTYSYDLIISNVLLPGLDGISLCQQLRARRDGTPILLLTESDTPTGVAAGLDAGADDYMIKPLDLVELVARVRALLRRKDLALVPTAITWGNLRLNSDSAEVMYHDQLLSLTPKEYGLLKLLMQHPQRVFSRSVILDLIWSSEVNPIEGTVTNHIKELRQKLKAAGMTVDIIETVYGLGYRLKAPPQPETLSPEKALVPKVASPATDPYANQPINPSANQDANQYAKVMIVDDDQATLDALDYLLYPWGLQVISLSQPERFWDVLTTATPDLLVLNLELLTLDSLDLCQRVRQDKAWGDLPIVAIATNTHAESVQKMFVVGVDDFVSKPIVGPELVTRVVSRLERLRYRDQARTQLAQVPQTQPAIAVNDQVNNRAAAKSASAAMAYANLLLVDDQPDNLRALAAILNGQGYKVRKAISGEIALDAIASLPPDLVLLDVKMLGMNGYEVCATLKANEQTRHIPVIFLSALDNTADKMKAFAVGGADYITKPFQAEEVLARVKHQLVIQRQQRQLAERNRQVQQAREMLRESEIQFRTAFEHLAIAVGFIGLDNSWLKVNPALCQLLDHTEAELLHQTTTAFIHPTDADQWQQSLQHLISNSNHTQNPNQNSNNYCRLTIRCGGNCDRSIPISAYLSLVCRESGQPLYVLAQMQTL